MHARSSGLAVASLTFLALAFGACAQPEPTRQPASETPGAAGGSGGSRTGGAPGSGGAAGTAGATGAGGGTGGTAATAATGGTTAATPGGSGGAPAPAPADAAPAETSAAADSQPAEAGSATPADATAAGGGALLVVGQVPPIGSDIQIQKELEAKGLSVTVVLDSKSTTADAAGKQVVILSYSVDSEEVSSKFTDVPAAIIVMEHVLLEPLGMTGKEHGWVKPATQITITAPDSPLAAGLPAGDVTVFSRAGSVFWGVPGPGALKAASVKGNPGRSSLFAYPKGAMMASKPAPGKRIQFFLGAHLVPEMFLNDVGLKLLGASIAWAIN